MIESQAFMVCGRVSPNGATLCLRRNFKTHDAATAHALKVDMSRWDDIWVQPHVPRIDVAFAPPTFPFSVEWSAQGHAYLTDANGRKLASLLGTQKQREWLAEILCRLASPQ